LRDVDGEHWLGTADGDAPIDVAIRVHDAGFWRALAANGSFAYTPTLNYTGADAFTYRATNGISTSQVTTVSLWVNAPPLATDFSLAITGTTPLTINIVPARTTDPEGGALIVSAVSAAISGTTALSGTGVIIHRALTVWITTIADTYGLTDRHDHPHRNGIYHAPRRQ
jgi:hypothetical protein